MSRIGIAPIKIEEGVTVELKGDSANVSGPLGTIEVSIPAHLKVEIIEDEVVVSRNDETKQAKSSHGTIRMLIANAVEGVKKGYEKKLEIVGVGYRAKMDGEGISIALGFNHPVVFEPHDGVTFDVPDENTIVVKGIDKQVVGQVAAKIREARKPEPYKGKGIRYEGEYVRRKSAKVVAAA